MLVSESKLRSTTMQSLFNTPKVVSRATAVVFFSLFSCWAGITNGQEKTFHLGEQAGKEIAISPDGERIALAAYDAELGEKKIILFDLKKEKVIGACWGGPGAYFQGLAFA